MLVKFLEERYGTMEDKGNDLIHDNTSEMNEIKEAESKHIIPPSKWKKPDEK